MARTQRFNSPLTPVKGGDVTAEVSAWISVDDGMPPDGKHVAILLEDPSVWIFGWVTAGYHHSLESGWWIGTPGDYRSCRDQRWEVTHWADLPDISLIKAAREMKASRELKG